MAFSVVLMLLEGVLQVLMYIVPIITGLFVLVTLDLYGKRTALAVFACVSVLSLALCADKEAALVYILFFGYYPLLKRPLEKLKKALSLILKLLLFNIASVAASLGAIYIFNIPTDEMGEFGKYTAVVILALGNVMFFLYDFCLTKRRADIVRLARKLKR